MPRIPRLEREGPLVKHALRSIGNWPGSARLTNVKRTLLRSPPAYRALMEWFSTCQSFIVRFWDSAVWFSGFRRDSKKYSSCES